MSTIENETVATMVQEFNPDDSINTDEFEIIARDVDVGGSPSSDGNASQEVVGQWSIQHSINLDPLLETLHSMPYLNSISTNINNGTLNMASPERTLPLPPANLDPNIHETAILEGSVINPRHEMDSIVTEDSEFSNSTLSSMIQKQDETKKLLEDTIAGFTSITGQLAESAALKQQVEELKKVIKDQMEVNREQMAKVRQLQEKVATPTDPSNLMEQLYTKGLEVDARDSALASLRVELDAARRRIADLEEKGVRQTSEKENFLSVQLDNMCAKYLQEKEQRELAEERLRASLHDRGDLFSTPMFDQNAVAEQLRLKTEQAEELERKASNAQEHSENLNEIIKVLSEDRLESTRLLAEKDQKISLLEETIEAYDRRLMLDSS